MKIGGTQPAPAHWREAIRNEAQFGEIHNYGSLDRIEREAQQAAAREASPAAQWSIEVREANGFVWVDIGHPAKGGTTFGASPDSVRGHVLRELAKDLARLQG